MQKNDPVPELSRKHFEEALRHARKSVTNTVRVSESVRISESSSCSARSSTRHSSRSREAPKEWEVCRYTGQSNQEASLVLRTEKWWKRTISTAIDIWD